MGELIHLDNDMTRTWYQDHALGETPRPTAIATRETDIQPSAWTVIETIAHDPELVACVELQQLGYTEVNLSDARLEAIEEIGLTGVREDILGTTEIGEGNFAVALAMCEETVRAKYGLDEQPLSNNW